MATTAGERAFTKALPKSMVSQTKRMIALSTRQRQPLAMLAIFSGVIFLSVFSPLPLWAQGRFFPEEEKLKATIAAAQDAVLVGQAFRTLLDAYLQRGDCEKAQEWFSRALERNVLPQISSYMLEIGRCLEDKFPARARELYEKIVREYPDEKDEIGDSYADAARRRLIWLSNDRSWRVRSQSQLVGILSRAIRRRDFGSLQRFVSKVNFVFGACQSEFLNSDLEEVAAFLDENYRSEIRIAQKVQKFPFREGWLALRTRGWSAPYDYIYFLIQPIPGGWEWIGAIYCDEPITPTAVKPG